VTAQGEQAAAIWRDTDFARDWAQGDSFRDLLDFPRRMAAAIVAGDNPAPVTVVDVGAGPGAVLEIFLSSSRGRKESGPTRPPPCSSWRTRSSRRSATASSTASPT
jgi:hypothetical protein